MENRLDVYESDDKRLMTGTYPRGNSCYFCIAEGTALGSLVSEFTDKGALENQVYRKGGVPIDELKAYLGKTDPRIVRAGSYKGVRIAVKCTKCGNGELRRELDMTEPLSITKVPVMPTLRCISCGQRFYSVTENYVRNLVESNRDLFTDEELAEKAKDEDAFIRLINEYVIRIFASKKIMRI
ncbi:MAG: hypothetical protein KGH69_02470 [Candidatus Micrarchaeota archaeon]|nr:hypothetical protein [Candidatus Micrarchaeota archaeon]